MFYTLEDLNPHLSVKFYGDIYPDVIKRESFLYLVFISCKLLESSKPNALYESFFKMSCNKEASILHIFDISGFSNSERFGIVVVLDDCIVPPFCLFLLLILCFELLCFIVFFILKFR